MGCIAKNGDTIWEKVRDMDYDEFDEEKEDETIYPITASGYIDIKCDCGKVFRGIENKEDTCPGCLKKLIKGDKH